MRPATLIAILTLLTACAPWVDAPGTFEARPVVDAPGSQQAVDAGYVVNWWGCDPGECTVHLAGHRSTHGATFAAVPSLRVGDPIRYGWGGRIYEYTVVAIEDFCGGGWYRPWADLTLQTSLAGGCVRLVHARAV